MREIGIDIETYSSHDLKSCGVYRYVEAPDFAIITVFRVSKLKSLKAIHNAWTK